MKPQPAGTTGPLPLTEADMLIARRFLESRLSQCHICNAAKWDIVGIVGAPAIDYTGGPPSSQRQFQVPMLAVACTECSNILLFAWLKVADRMRPNAG